MSFEGENYTNESKETKQTEQKKIIIFLLALAILVYGFFFYGVRIVSDHNIGGVFIREDGKLETIGYVAVQNRTFTEKEVTFILIPYKLNNDEVLEDQYTLVEIELESGAATVSLDKKSITIPPWEKIYLIIYGEGTYIGDNSEAKMLCREGPETRVVVIH